MKMLLTPDQESTLWHLTESLVTPDGNYQYSPYFLKHLGNGEYERLTYDQLPELAKDMILSKKGIKLPAE